MPGSNTFDYDIESLQSLIVPGQIADDCDIDLEEGGQGGRGQKSEQRSWGTMAQSDLRDSVEAKDRASGGTSGIPSAGLAQAKAWRWESTCVFSAAEWGWAGLQHWLRRAWGTATRQQVPSHTPNGHLRQHKEGSELSGAATLSPIHPLRDAATALAPGPTAGLAWR